MSDVYQITSEDLRRLLNGQHARLAKGTCTTAEAIHIMDISEWRFYEESNSLDTKLRPSKLKGKWILSSVRREFWRLHGERYEDAI